MKRQYFLYLKEHNEGIVIEDNSLQTIKQAISKYYRCTERDTVKVSSLCYTLLDSKFLNGYKVLPIVK